MSAGYDRLRRRQMERCHGQALAYARGSAQLPDSELAKLPPMIEVPRFLTGGFHVLVSRELVYQKDALRFL